MTPMEQAGLETVTKPVESGLVYTVDRVAKPPEATLMLAMLQEFDKTPIFLQVVWRTPEAPTTRELTWFTGKRVRQYWDPRGLTPTTLGKLRAGDKTVTIEPLPLRIAFAQAAVSIQN